MRWLALLGFVVGCFAVSGLGAWLTVPHRDAWYQTLVKPSLTPPDWVFGPVWTVLYLAMAVAAWLVWQQHGWSGARLALGLFAGQLLLNLAWSALFFAGRSPGAALIDLAALWLAILATLVAFWQKQPLAGLLLVPYLVWVSFAGYLNGMIWYLNR